MATATSARRLVTLPPTPLATFKAFHSTRRALRTGYGPRFATAFPPRVGDAAHQLRLRARSGEHRAPTSGFAPGFVQANVVFLPQVHAFDFLTFCLRNPQFCPLLGVTSPGQVRTG